MISIRAADGSDLSVLMELYYKYCAELQESGLQYDINVSEVPTVLSTRIKSKLFHVGIAEYDGEVRGFIMCSLAKIGREYLSDGGSQVGYINDIYVDRSVRRTGCANGLLESAKAWLKECGVNTLQLEVLSKNISGKSFWESVGGRETATLYQMKLYS